MTRKLENIYQDLTLPAEQGEAMRFLANTENAERINSLVEDIQEALMNYQVCIVNCSFSIMPNLLARLHYNMISTRRVVRTL